MKRMTLPAILVAAVLAFALVGCSGAQNMSEDTLKGTWALESGSDLGFKAYISFEDDSAVQMIVADSWFDGTWSVSGTEGKMAFSNGVTEEEGAEPVETTAKLTYSNNKLTVGSPNGSKLVFVKDDSDETKQQFAFDMSSLSGGEGLEGEEIEYVDEVINPIDPVAIADDDKFAISVTAKGTDYTGDPCYVLSVTNKTDKTVYLTSEDDFTVGGKAVGAGVSDEVEPGATIETQVYFPKDELGGGIEMLTSADGVIQLVDSETDETIASYTFHVEG